MQLKKAQKPLLILVIAMLVALVMVLTRPEAEQSVVVQKALVVDVLVVQKADVQLELQSYGQVLPRTQSTLTSEVAGRIVAVSENFVVGGFFKKNEQLLKIDDSRYKTALKKAEADVARAQSALAQEQGRAYVADQQWKTRNNKNVDQAAKDLALRKPQLLEASANLESAEANYQQAKDDLKRTSIRAPFDGLVRQKQADIGRYVTVGSPLAVSFAIDYAEVRLPIPEFQLAYLQLPDAFGQRRHEPSPILLTNSEGMEQQQWQAMLTRTEGVLDDRSRVLHVVARIEDPYGLRATDTARQPLRIGSFVEASLSGRLLQGLIEIPSYLLRPGNRVWLVDDNNQLQDRVVEPLKISANKTYIQAGLNDGDKLSLTSLGQVLEGRLVTINQQTLSVPSDTELAQPVTVPESEQASDASAVTESMAEEVAGDE
ncbi:Multidrug resistance protein MdtA [Sinobacterium norvegicum]|uniref:Multidrug resistance protein MdtA n=1 Tax=Sinobacterium norvegicum TaxID=1641715 RepID=A0ABM9ACG8_9GAMM|nr:efflux RND transporter periplasmic adaptor subunit [Sinobacterium norvegicum]CAH0990896.1 Multidrug resistance protein MdtA [Sinobacterium norvegicum]